MSQHHTSGISGAGRLPGDLPPVGAGDRGAGGRAALVGAAARRRSASRAAVVARLAALLRAADVESARGGRSEQAAGASADPYVALLRLLPIPARDGASLPAACPAAEVPAARAELRLGAGGARRRRGWGHRLPRRKWRGVSLHGFNTETVLIGALVRACGWRVTAPGQMVRYRGGPVPVSAPPDALDPEVLADLLEELAAFVPAVDTRAGSAGFEGFYGDRPRCLGMVAADLVRRLRHDRRGLVLCWLPR